jgi:hypothetical protein
MASASLFTMPALGALPSNEAMDSSKERLKSGEAFTSPPVAAALVPTKTNVTASAMNRAKIALMIHLVSFEVL